MDVNLEIRKLKTPEDLKKHHQLRHEVYVLQKGWETENGAGLEIDGWDQFSHHFGAFYDGKLVATLRLIDGRKTDLPIFRLVEEKWRQKNSLEISRVICRKQKKMSKMQVMLALYSATYEFAKNRGYEYVYAVIRKKHFRFLKVWLRMPFYKIHGKGPFTKKGEKFIPTIARISDFKIAS